MSAATGNRKTVAGFLSDADAAARAAWPDGDAVRLSRDGLVALRATIILPVNVAAAMEWHSADAEALPLAEFVREEIESGLDCELTKDDTFPPDARARFRLPKDEGNLFDRFAAVAFVRAEFARPSADEADRARQWLSLHFAPLTREEQERVDTLARRYLAAANAPADAGTDEAGA